MGPKFGKLQPLYYLLSLDGSNLRFTPYPPKSRTKADIGPLERVEAHCLAPLIAANNSPRGQNKGYSAKVSESQSGNIWSGERQWNSQKLSRSWGTQTSRILCYRTRSLETRRFHLFARHSYVNCLRLCSLRCEMPNKWEAIGLDRRNERKALIWYFRPEDQY